MKMESEYSLEVAVDPRISMEISETGVVHEMHVLSYVYHKLYILYM